MSNGVVLDGNTITINGKIIETGKFTFIQEPTSSPSVSKTTIDSDYKYMSFTNNNTEPSLIAFYKFDSPNGLLDHTGSHNLTAVNPQFDSTNKISGSSAFENGTNESYLQFPTSLTNQMYNINNTNGISFAFWYRLDNSSSDWASLIEFSETASDTSSTRRFGVGKHSGNNGFWVGIKYTGADYAQAFTIGSGTFDNTWHHFVWTINTSGNWGIYIDGTLQSGYTTVNYPRKIVNTTYNFSYIFKSVQSGQTKGYMDNFRIYNRVLPQADVTSLYTTYNTLPPQAYTINFPENTEVQLLLLDNLKYIETTPFLTTGSTNINVGVPSTFNTITTNTNATAFNTGYVSTITGASITYNTPLVILRYRYANYGSQWTYSSSNPNVYHLGNVGIGTTNPTSRLHVLGSVTVNGGITVTTLTANTKNFKIEHPLNINKWLYHGCVEAPRFDNIYRGKKIIINGKGEVDIDEECNTTGGMTKGTFVSLNTNCQVYLENKQTYDSVKGKITDGKLTINCENIEEEIEIEWLIMGERYDNTIITNELTNYEGKLICEHDKDQ
jgi:hypothetical protein